MKPTIVKNIRKKITVLERRVKALEAELQITKINNERAIRSANQDASVALYMANKR